MKDFFEHNGYMGTIEFSLEDMVMHGKILFISDMITYEASGIEELKKEFIDAVDDYLQTCKELGVEAKKPYSGSFQVRINQEEHRKAAMQAYSEGISLSKYVENAISEKNTATVLEINHTHKIVHEYNTDLTNLDSVNEDEVQWTKPIIQLNNMQQTHH